MVSGKIEKGRDEIINEMVEDYYHDALTDAQDRPASFGERKNEAILNPQLLIKEFTIQYKKYLYSLTHKKLTEIYNDFIEEKRLLDSPEKKTGSH